MKDGAEHIVSIHITHTLSGTVEAARQGANLAGADVTVIDSTFTDQCQKFQVVQAAKLAQEGASLEEVIAKVEEVRQKSELFIGVSTLENLVKGGRIGRVTGLLSSLLNIRVVMEMIDCELTQLSKGAVLRHLTSGLIALSNTLKLQVKKLLKSVFHIAELLIWQMALKKNWKFWVPQLLF